MEDIEEYIDAAPEARRAALTRLREILRTELAGFGEEIRYGMPTYLRDGEPEMAFASQKQYISVYVMRADVCEALASRLAGQDMGKSCLRFRRPELIDFDLVEELARATAPEPG